MLGTTRSRRALVAALLFVICALPSSAAAEGPWDPAATVQAYSAALNAHDLPSALALFDENGSAGNSDGRHFEGQAGLTEFLLDSGFGNPEAHIITRSLIVVANRALWTYTCSCAAGATDVRIVMNDHHKISVFSIVVPPAKPLPSADAGVLPWLVGLGLMASVLAGALGWRYGRSATQVPRPNQGRLLAALVQARAAQSYAVGGLDSERVELPAAAITSFSNSDDKAGPCSR